MEKGDFILIELEGKDEKGNIFDSTKGEIAKKLHGKEGPLLIILGSTPTIKGLEEELYRMDEGEERELIIPPSKAFGDRKKENFLVVPFSNFDRIPNKGEIVRIDIHDGYKIGIITSVSSGRVLIDINHPLAGKTLYFKVKVVKKLNTDIEKAEALLRENVREFKIEKNKAFIKDKLSKDEKKALESLFNKFNVNVELEFEDSVE